MGGRSLCLGQMVGNFNFKRFVQRNLQEIPNAIAQLRMRLELERDPAIEARSTQPSKGTYCRS